MTLLAGAASRDITPQQTDGLHLAGFGAGRTALGVLDPLAVLGGGAVVLLTAGRADQQGGEQNGRDKERSHGAPVFVGASIIRRTWETRGAQKVC